MPFTLGFTWEGPYHSVTERHSRVKGSPSNSCSPHRLTPEGSKGGSLATPEVLSLLPRA